MIEQATLRVSLFGVPRLFAGDRPLPLSAPPRTLPLLAYLVLEGPSPIPRRIVAERLWPDAPADPRAHLRRHLLHLDRMLGDAAVVERTAKTIALRAGALASDVADFRAASLDGSPARLAESVALYSGDLLESYDDEWIVAARERLRATHRRNLERLLDAARRAGERDLALRWAGEIRRLDPFDEAAVRAIMHLRRDAGDAAGALALYDGFAKRIRAELDTEPDDATIALAGEIASASRARRADRTLPLELTSFFGREDDVPDVARLLAERRLLSLVGPPGVGKTRLAIRASRAVRAEFPDGIWYVDLATRPPGSDVLAAIAEVLARGSRTTDVPGAIDDTLRDKRALVVLDNCEHLAPACAEAALFALAASDALAILATSRTPLGVDGEAVRAVAPLEPERAAADLFVDRARLVRPNANLDRTRVAALCAVLDGLPLAIELAATCLRTMSFNELVARLDERFALLRRDAPVGDPRHRTLRATFAWSFSLLSADARELVGRLAVFRDGWTPAAACAVSRTDRARTFAALRELVDQSLAIAPEADAAEGRYEMLVSTREFALAELDDDGLRDAARADHASWIAEYVAGAGLAADARDADFDLVEREIGNVRAALDYALGEGRAVSLGRDVVERLGSYWVERGRVGDGVARIAAALAGDDDPSPSALLRRASLHVFHSRLSTRNGDTRAGFAHADRALATLRAADAPALAARALLARARAAWMASDLETCERDARAARELCERHADAFGRARALGTEYLAHVSAGRIAAATACATEATRTYRVLGTPVELAESLANEGTCAYYRGDSDIAQHRYYAEAAALIRGTRAERVKCYVLANYAGLAWRLGDATGGWSALDDVFRIAYDIGNVPNIVRSFELVAHGLVREENAFEAAVFSAAAAQGAERFGVPYQPVELADRDRLRARVAAALSPERFALANATGATLTLEGAVARARAVAHARAAT